MEEANANGAIAFRDKGEYQPTVSRGSIYTTIYANIISKLHSTTHDFLMCIFYKFNISPLNQLYLFLINYEDTTMGLKMH
jgi:hypothetical protein